MAPVMHFTCNINPDAKGKVIFQYWYLYNSKRIWNCCLKIL